MKIKPSHIITISLGIIIGLTFGYFLFDSKPIVQEETIVVEKVKKEIVKDTIEIDKIIKVPVVSDTSTAIIDSLSTDLANNLEDEFENDSSEFDYDSSMENDSLEEIIIKEELIVKKRMPIHQAPTDSTDVSELLNMKSTSFSERFDVEFWESPLNLTGYTLSRNRLKLFGFNPNENFYLTIGNNENELIYNSETLSLILYKTEQFKTLRLR